jgi:hypothetical protein
MSKMENRLNRKLFSSECFSGPRIVKTNVKCSLINGYGMEMQDFIM